MIIMMCQSIAHSDDQKLIPLDYMVSKPEKENKNHSTGYAGKARVNIEHVL